MSKMMTMVMTKTNNGDGSLPSRYVPGAGAGRGWFQLKPRVAGYPAHDILSHALWVWDRDSMLMDYDAETGSGRFVIVDGNAPVPGTEIELEDSITPSEGASLTLTLGAEGIAALQSYAQAREQLRATGPSNLQEWSRCLEHSQREGAQLAAWVLKATQMVGASAGGSQEAPKADPLVEALEKIILHYPNPDITHEDYRVRACKNAEQALADYRSAIQP